MLRRVLAAAIILWSAPLAFAEGRFALVIGNASYRPGYELRNPVADARAVSRQLSGLGFEVTLLQNTDLATAQRALDVFVPRSLGADAVVIFYAGHGAMIDGRSFLLPVDFSMASYDAVDQEALDAERLMQALSSTHAGLKLLLLDACRNNPLETRGATAMTPPERQETRTPDMLVAFATAQGMTALDGVGDHSPFAEGLMGHMGDVALDVATLMTRVGSHVLERTDGRQTVWIESSLTRAFFLARDAAGSGSVSELAPPEPAAGQKEVFPRSGEVALGEEDLAPLDAATLRLARNEILARNGQIFTDPALTEHFSRFSWYQATTHEPALNAVETQNVERIRMFELRISTADAGFVFADSDRRLLERAEIEPLDRPTLRIARNEIYARRGRKFVRQELRDHFEQFDWYRPQFGEVELTYIEQKNVDLIRSFE